jgi:hypothetical protein
VRSSEALSQEVPTALHGLVLQIQASSAGSHDWFAPQVLLVAVRQPFASAVHTTTVEIPWQIAPVVVHGATELQTQATDTPLDAHVWSAAHGVVCETMRQPLL